MQAKLINAIDKILEDTSGDRIDQGYVYDNLAVDMAAAAGLVYDSCLKGQRFSDQQRG